MPIETPKIPVPTEGTTTIRVRYAECDPMRVAHHGSYAHWLEISRTDLLRSAGLTYAAMEAAGVFLVVTRIEIKYRRPLRYDDVIEIRVIAQAKGSVRLKHTYEVMLIERDGGSPDLTDKAVPADGVCAIAETELACVGASGRPMPLPGWLAGRS